MKQKPGDPPLIDEKGLRTDGRRIDELRPLIMKVNVLTRADGSAYVEHGGNKVFAAVYGPREIHPRHLSIPDRTRVRAFYRMASFSVDDRKRPAPSRREHELSKVITEALTPAVFVEKFPRTAIDIYIEVIQADGGTRTASINAASLALADAGIPMRDLVVAVAVGKVQGKVVLDLNNIEDQKGEADIPIAMMPRSKQITLMQMDGRLSADEIKEGYELFLKGAEVMAQSQKEALREEFGVSPAEEVTDTKDTKDTKELPPKPVITPKTEKEVPTPEGSLLVLEKDGTKEPKTAPIEKEKPAEKKESESELVKISQEIKAELSSKEEKE